MIAPENPRTGDVRALLEAHLAFAHAVTPVEHVHTLDLAGVLDPAVTLFGARGDGTLLGVGAISRLDAQHAELKAMHTQRSARRRGVGRAVLAHLLAEADRRGYHRVSLETGTSAAFAPARALYFGAGFTSCAPFAGYTDTSHSAYMTLTLPRPER